MATDDPRAEADPRVERSRRVVRQAALAELAEAGYGGFTVESVSARCGVARSTIYRHWPDKLALVADALETLNRQPRPAADAGDGGSARDRIGTLLRHLAAVFRDPAFAPCVPAMIEGAERHPEVRAVLHRYNAERGRALVEAVAAAVAAGEVAADVDPELAAVALAGPIVYRRLMTPEPFAVDQVDALVTLVLGPPPVATARG
jgi:AcrR family transcriptional regulator